MGLSMTPSISSMYDWGVGSTPLSFGAAAPANANPTLGGPAWSQQLAYSMGTPAAGVQAAAVTPTPNVTPNMTAASIASAAGAGSVGGINPGGANGSSWWNNAGDIMSGIGTLGSIWAAIQANKIAKQSLAFKKDAFNKNYNNQVTSYNTALSDRAWARAAATGQSSDQTQGYIDQNKL